MDPCSQMLVLRFTLSPKSIRLYVEKYLIILNNLSFHNLDFEMKLGFDLINMVSELVFWSMLWALLAVIVGFHLKSHPIRCTGRLLRFNLNPTSARLYGEKHIIILSNHSPHNLSFEV